MIRPAPVPALCLVLSLCLAAPLAAQNLPALYDVSGVAADDMLNVRAGPDAGADLVGTLAHNATGIEVTAVNEAGTWGRVNIREGVGWAALAYLLPQEGGAMPDVPMVQCFGTEPFWRYDVTSRGETAWSAMGEEELVMRADAFRRADGRSEPFISVARGEDQQGVLIMHPDSECSDGMSDGLYGLSADIVFTGTLERAVSGCCSIAAK